MCSESSTVLCILSLHLCCSVFVFSGRRRYTIVFFFFKQKTGYEILSGLVGSEMCIRNRGLLDGAEAAEAFTKKELK